VEKMSREDYLNLVIINDGTKVAIKWNRIKTDAESEDLHVAAMARYAFKALVLLKILTVSRDKAWWFTDLKMNPYVGSDSASAEKGRVFFVSKEDAIEYGCTNWSWRLDNWIITNGKEKLTRVGICQGIS
jgi:hypothetical protein